MGFIPLKRRARIQYGLGQPPKLSDDGVAIIRATNIFRGRIVANDLIRARAEDLPLGRAPLLKPGEVLVVRSGAYTGDSALVTPEWAGSAPGYDLRVTPGEELESRFLAYTMLGRYAMDQVDLAKSRAAQPHLNAEDLGHVDVFDTPISTQRSIADYLDHETARIDALIATRQRMVELSEERWQGSVSELTHARKVVDAAYRLPHGWNFLPLKRCLKAADYGIGDSSQAEGEYAVLGMANISSGQIVGEPGGFVSAVDSNLLLSPGDLLFNRTNSRELVGKVGLVRSLSGPTTFASYLVRLKVNGMADAQYLNYLLNTREVLGLARSIALPSIGQANLNPNRYSAIILPMPPPDEQRRLASCLNVQILHTARMRQAIERQIGLLRERRQALITATVTGQLCIPESA